MKFVSSFRPWYKIYQTKDWIKKDPILRFLKAKIEWFVSREINSTGKNPKATQFHLFCQIKFPRKVYLTEVSIYETYHAGAVVRIAAKDPQKQWIDVYNVTHAHLIRKSRKFSPKLKVWYWIKVVFCIIFAEREKKESEGDFKLSFIFFFAFEGSSVPSRWTKNRGRLLCIP